mgnify:CR=1 FL=1
MAKATFPSAMPGEFFILLCDRDMETLLIQCDDTEHSTHVICQDSMVAKQHLCVLWGLGETLMSRAVDQASEWGDPQQVIPSQSRVIRITPRVRKASVFTDAPPRTAWIGHV